MAVEKVQLPSDCLRGLRAPSTGHLAALARHLDELADKLQAKAVHHQTARGRALLKEEDRQRLELLRRRAADVRVARDQHEMAVGVKQGACPEPRAEVAAAAAAAGTLTPGRLQRAAAIHAAAAIASSAHGRGSAASPQQQRHPPPTASGLPPSSERPVPSSQRHHVSGSDAPATQAEPDDRSPHRTSGTECGSVPFRVCSPGSARRRQSLLGQLAQKPGRRPGRGAQDNPAEPHLGRASGASLFVAASQQEPMGSVAARHGLDPDQQAGGAPSASTGAGAWGTAPRSGRGGWAVDTDLGKLYVPRAWPALRATVSAATAAGKPVADEDPSTVNGEGKHHPSGGEAASRPPGSVAAVAGAPAGDADPRDEAAGRPAEDGPGCTANHGGGARGRLNGEDRRRLAAASAELRDTYKHFRRHCAGFKQYHEIQVALWLSSEQLVGREIRVMWPDEGAWFCGRVTRFDTDSGMHTVEYDDGDVEHLHLAAEEVRLQVVPGEAEAGLAPRPPEELRRVAECLEAGAVRVQQRADALVQQKQKAACKPAHRAKPPKDGGAHEDSGAADGEDPEELVAKAERWASRAAHLRALTGVMQRGATDGLPASSAARHRQPPRAPKAAKPTADGARVDALASGCTPTAAGAVPAAAAAVPALNPAVARASSAAGTADAVAEDGGQLEPGHEPGSDDVDGGGGRGGPAVADALPELPHDWTSSQVLRPGEVVWAQVRRSMPWPAIIITREEAEREGLNLRARQATSASAGQIAFVRFFGDHTVLGLPVVEAGARIPDRGGVLPFLAALELGWHARCATAPAAAAVDASGGGGSAQAAGGAAGAGPGSGGAQSQRFRRAMFELRTYMTEGELPRGMIPPNYDEDEDDEDDDGQALHEGEGGRGDAAAAGGVQGTAVQRAGARSGDRGAAGGAAAAGGRSAALPLVLGPKMRVLALGEVVWLSRWFHDEKYIYPVGYTAARMMASGASGGREVRHLMEVVASEDSVRPVFRITPEGEPPVSADTATRAMRALFEDDARARGRAFAKTGADLFGLSNQRVAALIRALPGAERCERFANWPDQDRSPVPPLTPHEELQRRALYARALRMPPGVQAVPQAKAGMCFECEVCGEDEEVPGNLKLECDLCRCVVHSRCYGVKQPPHGALWLCDVCQLHAAGLPRELSPPCELCPVVGGPMKRSESGGWVHLVCAVWTPGCTYGDPDSLEPVQGVAKAVQSRSSLRCFLCKQPHGACIQCAGDARCYTAFHPMCAREAGLAMCELRPGAAARTKAARRQPGGGGATAAPGMEVDDGKENLPGIPNSASAATAGAAQLPAEGPAGAAKDESRQMPGAKPLGAAPALASELDGATASAREVAVAAVTAARSLQRRGRGRPRRDGRIGARSAAAAAAAASGLAGAGCLGTVSLGNGISLACFCPRHEELVLHRPQFRCSYPGGRFADRRAELTREQLRARRQQQLLQEHALSRPAPQQQQLPPPPQLPPLQQQDGGGGGAEQLAGRPTGRAMSFADWRSRGHRAPEAVAIAREKRTFVRQLPYLVTGRLRQDDRALAGLEVKCVQLGAATSAGGGGSGSGCNSLRERRGGAAPGEGLRSTEQAGGAELLSCGASAGGEKAGGGLPRQLEEAAAAAGARSVAERYAAMRATVGRRLAAGKSAIHGWGAFAKVPHKRGDMLIEYVGELIRPSVSDARERRMYDKLVGCGTYIFTLNDEQHIDATRSGNMAHLLNHSCSPNCYSRTITLSDPVTGATSDHVIITAKRDIEAWEELTYDYRFNSAEELPCNCGAATCRLLVNWPEQAGDLDTEEEEDEEEAEEQECCKEAAAEKGTGPGFGPVGVPGG
ncbi:hypothetical protein PLESTM_000930800 [Pleodorina starrii]|nr:hypothetical protein PLESTM_000930800 [Pleodorina starrii]